MTTATLIARRTLTLAVGGNPNSGKTTLFNRLTGLRQKVGNYAGVTVEKKEGYFRTPSTDVELLDLPGTYGLTPKSEEERVAAEVLLGINKEVPRPDGVLCVVDSTSLEKGLYLVLQILEIGIPTAILLNMSDELEMRGGIIDVTALSKRLGVPVLAISATKSSNLNDLTALIEQWPTVPQPAGAFLPIVPSLPDVVQRRNRAREIARAVIVRAPVRHPSDKLDRVVMHHVWGPILFAVVVLVVFQAIFSWAKPPMDAIDYVFTSLANVIHQKLPDSVWTSLLADGVITGTGAVLVFLPQILIVFFFIAILENVGYLPRAALVMDRMLNAIGLQGKSFLPLISSYACAVPGIMAARTIENKRDRLATIFVAPFMTCSARLPVYALFIGAFIPDRPLLGHFFRLRAATLLGLYAAGFLAAMGTAWGLKSTILQSRGSPFFLEIPPYRLPTVKSILLLMWDRSKIFLRRAGTIILGVNILLWFLATFPRHSAGPDGIQHSFAGRIGKAMEPVIHPLGFNWKIGVGLVSAQAAREVMISSLATIYRVEVKDDASSLQSALKKDMTPLAAISLLIFFAFAMQCTSTLAVVRRETASWKIPVAMFIYMNAVAYAASFIIYQVGRWFGFS